MAAGDVLTKADPPQPEVGRRSFKPRYPGWLTTPSLFYYAIFFLGPLAILVAFSLATQTGFDSITYGFDTSQYHLVVDPLYLKIFYRTLIMAATGSILTMLVGYPMAYWMARYLSTYKLLALLLILVPFWTSFLIRTYALKIILDPKGYLARDLASTSCSPSTRWAWGWCTTTCRCSSCRCSPRWSGWTGR